MLQSHKLSPGPTPEAEHSGLEQTLNRSSLPLEDSPYLLDQHGPVFILGCPRSGTTFLSNCIADIPDLEEFVGILAPPRIMHLIGYGSDRGEPTTQLLKTVRDIFWQAFWRRRLFFSYRLGASVAMRKFRALLQKPTLAESIFCYKEPFLCFAAEEFAVEFSNSKFIHIIRDGRDNADSMMRSYPDALTDTVLSDKFLVENKSSEVGVHRDVRGFAVPWWIKPRNEEDFLAASQFGRYLYLWREMTVRAQVLRKLGPDRYLEIRYEEFVDHSAQTVSRVCRFLGRNPAKSKKARNAFSGSVGISASRQGPGKLAEANLIAGDLLRSLGYQTLNAV
jgi:Sulfotransferase family